MPRSLRTKLTIRLERYRRELAYLQERVAAKEEDIEDLQEVIRTKGQGRWFVPERDSGGRFVTWREAA